MTAQATIPARSREVFEYLRRCARDMRTVSYGKIARAVGLANPGIGAPLGYVRDSICRSRGLPWLNAIAVNKKTRRPGKSFLPQGIVLGNEEERMWRGMVLQVLAYDWESVDFDGQ